MIKALLLDADGVSLVKPGYFSQVYSKEYNVPSEKITPFFKNEYRNCQLGKADVKKVLPKYLQEWGWQKSVDDFLEYWFSKNTVADERVVQKVQEIRRKGIKCYLATDQEKYRAEYTRKNLDFDHKFDECFFSCEIGYSKSDPQFFQAVLFKVGLEPSEILYLDDENENVQAAKQVSISARLYNNLSDLDI